MNPIERITLNPKVMRGKPTIRNMRFSVAQMLELLAGGMSQEEILGDYPFLEKEDVQALLDVRFEDGQRENRPQTQRVKFLVDTQLPPSLADYFSGKGHPSIHTTFFGAGPLAGRCLNCRGSAGAGTHCGNQRFRLLPRIWVLQGTPPSVLLIEFGNVGNKILIQLFDQHIDLIIKSFQNGSELVIFRKDKVIIY